MSLSDLSGAILLQLGLTIGQRLGSSAPKAAFNLLQRATSQRRIADELLDARGAVRLIEFRNARSTDRARQLLMVDAALRRLEHLRPLARAVHWYVQSTTNPEVEARPYFERHDPRQGIYIGALVDGLVDEALAGEGGDHELLREYLGTVAVFARAAASSALLLQVSDAGAVRYVFLEDVRDLNETPARLLEFGGAADG